MISPMITKSVVVGMEMFTRYDGLYLSIYSTTYARAHIPHITHRMQQGILSDGELIAVKKLSPTLTFDGQQFMQEFDNLMRVRHPNIVRLVGYCYETKRKHIEINGAYKLASIEERALCFEYLKHGSLDKHLSGNKY